MKIDGPSKTGGAQKTGKAKKAGKTDSSFGDMVTEASQATSAASPAQTVSRVDALLAVQGVDSATEGAARRRMHHRADAILEKLDDLKLSLLSDGLTVGQVINIADMVASHRERINDPEMTALLDEIDLRAQIELAKIRKAIQ